MNRHEFIRVRCEADPGFLANVNAQTRRTVDGGESSNLRMKASLDRSDRFAKHDHGFTRTVSPTGMRRRAYPVPRLSGPHRRTASRRDFEIRFITTEKLHTGIRFLISNIAGSVFQREPSCARTDPGSGWKQASQMGIL